MARVIKKKFRRARVRELPLADGGDGTLEVLAGALKGRMITTTVRGPLGKKVKARWAISGSTAIIEMARASGLALIKGRNKILETTTFGTGELIRAALDHNCKTILIGVGGTATADGGSGALRALGMNYTDKHGRELSAAPNDLIRLHAIHWEKLDARLAKAKIYILCDVKNPLLGPNGSARVFGPQKGATKSQVRFLEKYFEHWSKFVPPYAKASGGLAKKLVEIPGVGAAGGLSFGLMGFLGAVLARGTPFIMDRVKWNAAARRASHDRPCRSPGSGY
jgi:glycerate kinase